MPAAYTFTMVALFSLDLPDDYAVDTTAEVAAPPTLHSNGKMFEGLAPHVKLASWGWISLGVYGAAAALCAAAWGLGKLRRQPPAPPGSHQLSHQWRRLGALREFEELARSRSRRGGAAAWEGAVAIWGGQIAT